MGKILVKCAACQATFEALLSFAGQIRPCPRCKKPLQIPILANPSASKSTAKSDIRVSTEPLISEPPLADAERLATASTLFRPLIAVLSIICVCLVMVLVFVPAPKREQLSQGKTTPVETPTVTIEPVQPQPPVVDNQPVPEVSPPPAEEKQPSEKAPDEKDLLPIKPGEEMPLADDPPEAKPDPVLPAVKPLEPEAVPQIREVAPRGRGPLLSPPPMFGTQFQWNQLPGDEQEYLLARHISFTPYQRKLSFPLAQFEPPKDTYEPWKNYHMMPMWTLQLNTAQKAMELAMSSGDFAQLANDLAMLRTIRVHLGWMLAIHLTDSRYDEQKGNVDFLKKRHMLLLAWEAYLLCWNKLAEKFEKELRAAAITPLHNPEDIVFMNLLFKPPPPPPKYVANHQFNIFPRMIYNRYPAVENLQGYYQAERQARRLSNPELLCHLADLHWLAEPNRAGLVNLRYHQRHGRIVTGLRIGIIVHHEDSGKTLRDYFSGAEYAIKGRNSHTKFTRTHPTHTNRQLCELLAGVPYQQMVAELHARMVLGQFGPAYADLHPWDQQNIGQMAIFSVNLTDALKTAWLSYWDYAIIIKKSHTTADLEIKLVDLIALDELGKVVIRKPPTDIATQTEDYRKSLVELLKLVDFYVTLRPLPEPLPVDLEMRQKFQKGSFLRESLTSLILEKTYREQFLKQDFPLASDSNNSTRQGQYNLYFRAQPPMDVPLRTCYLTMSILGDAFFQAATQEKPYSFPYNKD